MAENEHIYDKVERLGYEFESNSLIPGRYGYLYKKDMCAGVMIYDKAFYATSPMVRIDQELLDLIEGIRFECGKREMGTLTTVFK
jgi:hypothetical protein